MWSMQGSPLSPAWTDLKTNGSSSRVQSLREEHFLCAQRAFPEALCLSPAQLMLSLFPPSWQIPVLQNKDDISAVVLALRKSIILASPWLGGSTTPLFVPWQGGPWRPRPRPNTRPVCGETCTHTQDSIPSQVPGPVAHLASSWALLIMPKHTKEQLCRVRGWGPHHSGSAVETGNRDWAPLLLPLKIEGLYRARGG